MKIELSIVISIIALLFSIWGRIESFSLSTHQRKLEITKKIGDALISSQQLKNTLFDFIEILKDLIEKSPNENSQYLDEARSYYTELEKEYEFIWDFVKKFERIIVEIEKGKFQKFKSYQIEAKIYHLNQRRILVEYDLTYIKKLLQNK